jgi:hypothetical protein
VDEICAAGQDGGSLTMFGKQLHCLAQFGWSKVANVSHSQTLRFSKEKRPFRIRFSVAEV